MPNYQQLLDAALDRAQDDRPIERNPPTSRRVLGDRGHRRRPRPPSPTPPRARADEIIGTRGYGRARALLGSVAHELIHLADCPITVIPERVVDREEPRDGGSGVMS